MHINGKWETYASNQWLVRNYEHDRRTRTHTFTEHVRAFVALFPGYPYIAMKGKEGEYEPGE